MNDKTVVLGLTGQTGAGKSTVGEMLRLRGAAWVDADAIAHDVTDNEKVCLADLALEFTIDILNVDGTLNRKKLGEIVFHDKAKLPPAQRDRLPLHHPGHPGGHRRPSGRGAGADRPRRADAV